MGVVTKYLSWYELGDNKTLVLNAFSGAIDLVDDKTRGKIERFAQMPDIEISKLDEEDKELLELLQKRGYIIKDRNTELNELCRQKLIHEHLCDIAILHVICPTMFCNLKCSYCFEPMEVKERTAVMSGAQVEVICNFIKKIKSTSKTQTHRIQLFGGEPILPSTKNANVQFLQFAEDEKIPVSIITNGTFVKDYQEVFEKYENTVDSVQITLDGNKEIHDKRRIGKNGAGTFDDICAGIDFLLSTNIRQINIRVNVDRANIEKLTELDQFIEEKGWRKHKNFIYDLAPVTDHTSKYDGDTMTEDEIVKRLTEIYPEYQERKLSMFRILSHISRELGVKNAKRDFSKFTYCEANRGQYYVYDPFGNIYACPEAIGNENLAIGKYDDEKVSLNEQLAQKWANRSILSIPKCLDCNIAPFCGGGCAFAALKTNGNLDCPVCNNAHEVLKEYVQSIKEQILDKFS